MKSPCGSSARTYRPSKGKITLAGRPHLTGRELMVPSDLSSAAFFIVAALLVPGSQLTIRGVGLNPTRSALLDFLTAMGAKILIPTLESRNGELIGDIIVQHSALKGGTIEGALTAALIDEIPVLAVLGAATEEGLTVRDAGELRVKETDRIRTVVDNLRRLGVEAEEQTDGMMIPGRQKFRGGRVRQLRRSSHRHGLRRGGTARRWPKRYRKCRCRIGQFPRILEHAGENRVVVYALARSSRISASSAMVFWMFRRIISAISSMRATAWRIQANCTLIASASRSRRIS